MKYISAKEFGNQVKKELYEYQYEPDDLEARLIALKQQYAPTINNLLQTEFDAINTKYQNIVDDIIENFLNDIPSEFKGNFEKYFYFSTIDNNKISAHIRRSSDKQFFAIFINSALINLLTKIGKLDTALVNPNCVVYCNRFPNKKPTTFEIQDMRKEYFDYFSTNKMSYGPFLIIEGTEAEVHFSRLHIQEKFIIFHEVAHFLNGDMFIDTSDRNLISPFTNKKHQVEHLADILAFALLLNSERKNLQNLSNYNLFIISSIIHLFDIMSCIQAEDAESHPHPLNRMNAIIETYYGLDIVDIIGETYKNRNSFNKLYDTSINLRFELSSLSEMIQNVIYEAFKKENWS